MPVLVVVAALIRMDLPVAPVVPVALWLNWKVLLLFIFPETFSVTVLTADKVGPAVLTAVAIMIVPIMCLVVHVMAMELTTPLAVPVFTVRVVEPAEMENGVLNVWLDRMGVTSL